MKYLFIKLIVIGVLCFLSACSKNDSTPQSVEAAAENVHLPPQTLSSQNLPAIQSQSGRPVATNLVSQQLQSVLASPARTPPAGWFTSLKLEDRSTLLEHYRRETELTNKLAATMALGFVGDSETAKELENTLLHLPADHVLNMHEESVLLMTVEALGLLAQNQDSAWQFLTKATDPWFWKHEVPWRTEDGNQCTAFGGRVLAALAMSQRQEIDEIFNRIKQQPAISDLGGGWWIFNGALVDAVFFRDLISQHGFEHFKAVYGTEDILNEWNWWKNTENGTQWIQWARDWNKAHPKEAGLLPAQ